MLNVGRCGLLPGLSSHELVVQKARLEMRLYLFRHIMASTLVLDNKQRNSTATSAISQRIAVRWLLDQRIGN